MPEDQDVTLLRPLVDPEPPALRLRPQPAALPATLCRTCWTFHRPVEPCGPSGRDAA